MESCLGILTENNLIKYAKVSRERDNLVVDAYGVKFYDDIQQSIQQIVEETKSKNTPININLSDEIYSKFEVFSGLKQKDIESILSSEFELLCDERNLNFQALTSTYILSQSPIDKEKANALYVSANRGDIAGKLQKLEDYKIKNLVPVPIALCNLLPDLKENTAIVNIEDKTTVSIIVNGDLANVKVIDIGMRQILDQISLRENSYAKAYQACKNTTIYTVDVADGQLTGSEYLQDIMPILYQIVGEIKKVLEGEFLTAQRILLTGTATIINNLELYFQEYFPAMRCELLSPNIALKKVGDGNANTKELMEVNSAIALAQTGLGVGIQETNFKNIYTRGSLFTELKKMVTKDVALGQKEINSTTSSKKNKKKAFSNGFQLSMKGELDGLEKAMIRTSMTLLMIIVIFSFISIWLTREINAKISLSDAVISDTNKVISTIESDTTRTNNKKAQYEERMKKLDDLTNQVRSDYQYKRAIPNLLNQIMAVIPVEVQLTSIENASDNKITIAAQSPKYEDLGYFGAVLKNQGILLNLTVSAGTREGDLVKINIEGNLP